MRLKVLLNLGDDWPRDKNGDYYQQDEVYDFDQVTADKLLRAGLAEPPASKASKRAAEESEEEEDEAEDSPVSQDNAHEAITAIAGMRSKEKLQSIVDTDKRETVKEAARRRLAAL